MTVVGISAALLMFACAWFVLSRPPLCSSKTIWESASPDRSLIMTASELDCGATTSMSLILSIMNAGDELNLDIDSDDVVLTMNQTDHIDAKWISNNQIDVSISSAAKVFKQQDAWKTVKLNYKKQ